MCWSRFHGIYIHTVLRLSPQASPIFTELLKQKLRARAMYDDDDDLTDSTEPTMRRPPRSVHDQAYEGCLGEREPGQWPETVGIIYQSWAQEAIYCLHIESNIMPVIDTCNTASQPFVVKSYGHCPLQVFVEGHRTRTDWIPPS